jgi:site-specific recombinase XerD
MGVYKKNGKWYIDYYYEGRRIREMVGTNKRVAEDALAARRIEIARDKFRIENIKAHKDFRQLCEKYIEYAKDNKKSWRRDISSIGNMMPFFEKYRLSAITPQMIEEYKHERKRDGVTNATINRELACLKHMFNLAITWQMARKNPVIPVKFLKETNQRDEWLTPEEIKRLLNACSKHLKPIVHTALNTGMRLNEILNLKWSDVNLEQNVIMLDETKSGTPRQIPINNSLRPTLLNLASKENEGPVFLNKFGKQMKSVRTQFENALRRAGIKRKITFHDLRHTFATHLVMGGVDLVAVKELLGHKTIRMTLRYSHLSSQHKRHAVNILGERLSGSDGHYMDTKSNSQTSKKV